MNKIRQNKWTAVTLLTNEEYFEFRFKSNAEESRVRPESSLLAGLIAPILGFLRRITARCDQRSDHFPIH